jgi:hypothetical protein
MKKLALILAFMLIPCAAFGLQMLDDSAMDAVTGQSGVHIAFDDVQMFINIEKLAWIDCDGLTSNGHSDAAGSCAGGAAAIGLNNFQIDVLNVNAIVTSTDNGEPGQTVGATGGMELFSVACGEIPLFYDYGSTGTAGCYLTGSQNGTDGLDNYTSPRAMGGFQARALTIDATREMPAITAGLQNNTGSTSVRFGGVIIGIPTVEIYINAMSLTPIIDVDINGYVNGSDGLVTVNDDGTGADFGTIYMEGITFTSLSGWVEIGPHGS